MRKWIILNVLMLLPMTQAAWASGSYTCTVNDKNMKFEMTGLLSHSFPSGPLQEQGSLQLKDPKLKSYNLPKVEKSTQFWQVGDELNLLLYYEPVSENTEAATLTIKTKYNDSTGVFSGAYQYTVRDWQSDARRADFAGEVKCEVE